MKDITLFGGGGGDWISPKNNGSRVGKAEKVIKLYWNFRTIYGARNRAEQNMDVVPARQAT